MLKYYSGQVKGHFDVQKWLKAISNRDKLIAKKRFFPILKPLIMKYKFTVHIRRAKNKEFFSVLVSTNGQDVYVQETRKRKATVVKQVKGWFPGVKIVDETLKA